MTNEPTDLETTTAKPARFEVKAILALVAAAIVLGGAYVFFAGSPTKNRATIDSDNGPATAVYVKPQLAQPHSPQH